MSTFRYESTSMLGLALTGLAVSSTIVAEQLRVFSCGVHPAQHDLGRVKQPVSHGPQKKGKRGKPKKW